MQSCETTCFHVVCPLVFCFLSNASRMVSLACWFNGSTATFFRLKHLNNNDTIVKKCFTDIYDPQGKSCIGLNNEITLK